MGVISKVLQNQQQRDAEEERKLIRFESSIGRQLFGEVPEGHTREFFCLDQNTWIWHEEWIDNSGQKVSLSTKYSVRPSGIIKSINNEPYTSVNDTEKRHLLVAIKHYVKQVTTEYNRVLQDRLA
jgi:hypothetical protein